MHPLNTHKKLSLFIPNTYTRRHTHSLPLQDTWYTRKSTSSSPSTPTRYSQVKQHLPHLTSVSKESYLYTNPSNNPQNLYTYIYKKDDKTTNHHYYNHHHHHHHYRYNHHKDTNRKDSRISKKEHYFRAWDTCTILATTTAGKKNLRTLLTHNVAHGSRAAAGERGRIKCH